MDDLIVPIVSQVDRIQVICGQHILPLFFWDDWKEKVNNLSLMSLFLLFFSNIWRSITHKHWHPWRRGHRWSDSFFGKTLRAQRRCSQSESWSSGGSLETCKLKWKQKQNNLVSKVAVSDKTVEACRYLLGQIIPLPDPYYKKTFFSHLDYT